MYTASEITSPTCFRETDKFLFQCFKLSRHHTTTINNIFLEEAHTTSSIIYHSQGSLKSSLEQYVKSETTGINAVLDPCHTRHLPLIVLEKIARDLGSSVSFRINAPYGIFSPPRMFMSSFVAYTVASKLLPEKHTEMLPLAYSLMNPEASERAFWSDTHQAGLMMILRTKRGFFMEFPPERLWLYLKISRNMNRFDDQDFTKQIIDLELEGPEDDFPRYIALFPSQRTNLVKAMYYRAIV